MNYVFLIQIECIADLPVGDNLQDHLFVVPTDYTIEKPLSNTFERSNSFQEIARYLLTNKGVIITICSI